MKKEIISIPWIASIDLPNWIREFFGDNWKILNVHLNENNETISFEDSINILLKYFEKIPYWEKIILRWHSLATRIIIHSIIKNPEILSKISNIQLITPPFNLYELNDSKIYKIIKRNNKSITFTDEFSNSLKNDDENINLKFWKILKKHQYDWKLEIFIDPKDPILTMLDKNYFNNIQGFIASLNPELEWLISKYWDKIFPKVKIKFINFWHNFELYNDELKSLREDFKLMVLGVLVMWVAVWWKYNIDLNNHNLYKQNQAEAKAFIESELRLYEWMANL